MTSDQWVPHLAFKSLNSLFHPTDRFQHEWPDERQEIEFAKLFIYLINELGGEMVEEGDRESQIMEFSIDQLATALEVQQRPFSATSETQMLDDTDA
jgi:hypothetical protein